jgi:hypothetical protein
MGTFRKAGAALIATCLASLSLTAAPHAAAKESPTQAVIASGPGCGNSITATAIDYDGSTQGKRTLVQPRPGYQLISHGLNTRPMVLLYSAYNCESQTFELYSLPISPAGSSTLILQTAPGQWLVDAAWDVKNDAPSVLVRDGDTYSIQTNRGAGWSPIWRGSRTQLGYSLDGMDGETGGEYVIFGNSAGSGWATFRVGGTGFINRELAGPGQIRDLAETVLEQAAAYLTTSGTYVCDFLTSGDVTTAQQNGRCVLDSAATAADGVFVAASPSAKQHRLLMNNADLGPSLQTVVTCTGGTLFSCGRVSLTPSTPTTYIGQDLIYMPLFDVDFQRLGSGASPSTSSGTQPAQTTALRPGVTQVGTGNARYITYADGKPNDTCFDNPSAQASFVNDYLEPVRYNVRKGDTLTWAQISNISGVEYCADGDFFNFGANSIGKRCTTIGTSPQFYPSESESTASGSITVRGGVKAKKKGNCRITVRTQRGGAAVIHGEILLRIR